jgi:hypothetical protein
MAAAKKTTTKKKPAAPAKDRESTSATTRENAPPRMFRATDEEDELYTAFFQRLGIAKGVGIRLALLSFCGRRDVADALLRAHQMGEDLNVSLAAPAKRSA